MSVFLSTNMLITREGNISVFVLLQEDQYCWQAEEYRGAGVGKDAAAAAGGHGAAEEE